MPWKEQSVVSQREEFCRLSLQPGACVRELSRRYGVSSSTGYEWRRRYLAMGVAGLEDRSRRPLSSPRRTPAEVEALVLAVRRDHPAWGGRKIHRVLKRTMEPPPPSTITEILRRHGMLTGPKAGQPRDWQRFEHPEPNDLWQMDFKGHFALRNGRCHPLTVLDDHSRFSLEIGACANERTETVQERLTLIFERYGLPWKMLADNGSPWGASGSIHKHTRLTIWLIDLDIPVIHGRAYHPQTQGKEERFHRTLIAEVLDGYIFDDLDQAQNAFDDWRHIYNTVRPHEGIGMATPSSRYVMSQRRMPDRIDPPEYEAQTPVRKVHDGGWISFRNREINCSKALVGRYVALRATQTDGVFDLCYRSHVIDTIDMRDANFRRKPVRDVPVHPLGMSPV